MMRFQPSALSSLQRQSLLESLSHLRQYNRMAQQRDTRGEGSCCCSQATRIANASERRNTALPSLVSRHQQRQFGVSRTIREQDLPPIGPPPSSDKEKKGEETIADISSSTGRRKRNVISPKASLTQSTSPQSASEKGTSSSLLPNPQKKAMKIKLGWRRRNGGSSWFAAAHRLRDSPLRYDDENDTLETKVRKMDNAISTLFALWNEHKEDGLSIPKHISVAVWLANFGTQCRLLRKDKVNYDRLLRQISKHLEKMIIFIGSLINESAEDQKESRHALKCLQIQALSFQDRQEAARARFDTLLIEDWDWLEELEEIEETSSNYALNRKSHPRLVSLADALGSILQITLDRCASDRKELTSTQIAEEAMDWLIKHPGLIHFNSQVFAKHMFRFNVLTNLLKDPLLYIESRQEELDSKTLGILATLICRCLLRESAILPAYRIYRWALAAKVELHETVPRLLVRLATLEKESLLATRMVQTLVRKARNGERVLDLSTCRTIALSCARRRDEKMMEEVLHIINTQYSEETSVRDEFAFGARLLCYSRLADVTKTIQLVEQRYDMQIAPNEQPADGLLYPDQTVHERLVQLYLGANQREQAESMLHRMVQFGYQPDTPLLAYVMEYYARIDDLASTVALFQQMKNSKLGVDVRICTSLIALFARRKDSVSALKVIELMQDRGLSPDRITYNALLSAHVEAGDWQAAMDLFEWMRDTAKRGLQPNSHTYNIILKAHILRAVPVQEVFQLFKQIMEAGIDPGSHTLSMILQSVVDAQLMNLAEQVFSSIEDRLGGTEGKPAGKGAGIWHFTIMIQGYLRAGQVEIAREYANELRERGQTATGVLWSVLVKAYSARDEDVTLKASHQLVQSARFTNPKEYIGAYQPLIEIHSKRASVEQVEILLNELTEKEADVPINLWTALMDAFRRQDNLAGTLEIWNLIFDKALEVINFTDSIVNKDSQELVQSSSKVAHTNLLCLPLSILIDALARQGDHKKIAQEWLRCRKAGFAFDSHNWNHLCAAFLRAGRIIDSLNIINRVLSNEPPSSMWRKDVDLIESRKDYSTSFEADEVYKTATPSRPPNRRHQTRFRDNPNAYYPLEEEDGRRRLRREEISASSSSEFYPTEEVEDISEKGRSTRSDRHGSDSSNILRYLQKEAKRDKLLSPYYPHFATMAALDEAIENIEKSGGTVKVGDRQVGLNEIMEEYPRVIFLRAQFREKTELLQELARNNAFQQGRQGQR